jgi:hypothetical protein
MCTQSDNVNDEKINVSLTVFGSIILVALLVLLNGFPSLTGVWIMTVGSSAVFVVPDVVLRGILWLAFVGTAIGSVVRFVRLLQDALCEPVRTCT